MKLTFHGAARRVTGSCYLLETSSKRLLIDCGMIQGGIKNEKENYDPFEFDPASIDAVLLTHAHLDHTGRVPKLVKDGFRGEVHATAPTARLAALIMEDSVKILGHEAERKKIQPLYEEEHYLQAVGMFQEHEYRTPYDLGGGVTVEFFDAGHILGSSCIRVTDNGKSIVFSGDLGNPPVPLLHRPDVIGEADYVVMESTYGARHHEPPDERSLILQSALYETATLGGVLMIPAFALERTQEILYELNEMKNNGDIPDIPIYLDSPLAIKATRVFREFQEDFNLEAQEIYKNDDDLFSFPGLKMTEQTAQSKAINDAPAPKVIIAGSGMATGGRIIHHIKRYIGFFANTYLIVGYQVNGTLGRRLLNGDKKVKIHGEEYTVRARVRAIGGYSAHADQEKLTTWLSGFNKKRLKQVFLTHGEEDQAMDLQQHFHQRFEAEISVPELGDSVDLA